jgi:hypothetical protein
MKNKLLLLCALLPLIGFGQLDLNYQQPHKNILELADAPMPPSMSINPNGSKALLIYRNQYQTIEDLAEDELRLAGLRINPKTNISSRTRFYVDLKLFDPSKKKEFEIENLPANPKISNINWSPNYNYIAFTNTPSSRSNFPEGLLPFIETVNANKKGLSETFNTSKNKGMDENQINISINNSGLILLWPFFTQFFEKLELLKEGAFINSEARNRAVYLLQYLACYDVDFPEHQLVLNKQLVGMFVEEPLLTIAPLTPVEKELAESLLRAFKTNWDKVQGSTIEALQVTFFQREGFLEIGNDKSTLQIGKKGVDALVSTIPWNFSLIKLPWMQQPLHIQWL